MPSFGTRSTSNLITCDQKLQDVLNEAIKHFDFSIIWGHRGMEEQNRIFDKGYSKLRWPMSRHNTRPSRAFDVVPYPDGYRASDETFYFLATCILRAAMELGIHLTWGGHWKNFKDLAHFQLKDN